MAYNFNSSTRILFPKFASDILLPSTLRSLPLFPIRRIQHAFVLPSKPSFVHFQSRPISSYRRRLRRSRQQFQDELGHGELDHGELGHGQITTVGTDPDPETLEMSPEQLRHILENYHVADWVEDDWLNEAVNNRSIPEMMAMGYLEYGKRKMDVKGPKGTKRRVNELKVIYDAMNSWTWSDDEEEGEKIGGKRKRKKGKKEERSQDQSEERNQYQADGNHDQEEEMREGWEERIDPERQALEQKEEEERQEREKIEKKKKAKKKREKEEKKKERRELEKQKKREEYAQAKEAARVRKAEKKKKKKSKGK